MFSCLPHGFSHVFVLYRTPNICKWPKNKIKAELLNFLNKKFREKKARIYHNSVHADLPSEVAVSQLLRE